MDQEPPTLEICSYSDVEDYRRRVRELGLQYPRISPSPNLKPGEYLRYSGITGLDESYLVNPYSEFVWKYPELLLGMQVSIKRHMHKTFGSWVGGTPCLRGYQFSDKFREIMPSIAQEIFVSIP